MTLTDLDRRAWQECLTRFQPPPPRPRRWASPLDMACELNPQTVRTPALEAINDALVRLADRPGQGKLAVFMSPQEGKLVADDVRVPTPDGWVRHGDLEPGSVVFHPSGRQVKVTDVHPPAMASLRVHFSDHTSVLVHPAHEWTVHDRGRGRVVTLETRQMAAVKLSHGPPGRRGHKYRFHIPLREALDCPDRDFPLDPYALGVWLGDGSSTKPAVTHHPDDRYELPYPETAHCVHPTTGIVTTYYGGTLRADLIAAGVFRNKHIPAAYLRGSIKQRRALLAGLIDTDGHVSASGQVSFDNANAQLVHETAELVRTLGYRAHVHRPTPPKLSTSGIQGKQEMWRVTFTPHDQGPARLPRKATVKVGRRERAAIVAITEERPQVGRCITVDSEDGLYLVGDGMQPTHNSTLCSYWNPLWLLEHDHDLRIIAISYNAEKSREWGAEVKNAIENFNGEDGLLDLGIRLRADTRAAGRWKCEDGQGGLYCAGIASGITGRAGDYISVDDPTKNMQEAQSETMRGKVTSVYRGAIIPRMGPTTKLVWIQTLWHESETIQQVLANEGDDWEVIRIPAIADSPDDPLGRAVGEPMTSARGHRNWQKIRRDVGEYVFAALYQQRPAPAEGNIFKRLWWRYWVPAPAIGSARRLDLAGRIHALDNCWRFGTVDLANSTRTSADWTVISAWARTLDGDLVLLDRHRSRIGQDHHFAQARPLVERWRLDTLFVEESQFGTTLVREATRAGVPISPVKAETDKLTRALPASAMCSNGRVWLPAGVGWLDDWIGEHAGFPNAAHDDQVDTLSYAVRVGVTGWHPRAPAPSRAAGPERDPLAGAFGGASVDLMAAAL